MLHSPEWTGPGTLAVGDEVAMSSGLDVLRAMAEGAGPARRRVMLGYAGWGPGQLEGELEGEGWFVAPADIRLIFADDPDGTWTRALQAAGTEM